MANVIIRIPGIFFVELYPSTSLCLSFFVGTYTVWTYFLGVLIACFRFFSRETIDAHNLKIL